MRLVALGAERAESMRNALDALDRVRESLAAGEFVGFAFVGLKPNDDVRVSSAKLDGVSCVRMMGAIERLRHWIHVQEDEED